MISRRRFLATGAVAALAPFVPSRLISAVRANTPPIPDLSDWATVRAQFDLEPDLVHLSSFFIASHPKPVRDAIEGYRRAIDADPYEVVDTRMFQDGPQNVQVALREQLRGYLGAATDEIAITRSTTEGLALVHAGMPLEPGDEVLATAHDHYAQHESIRFACAKRGATWRRIALYDDPSKATAGDMVGRLRAAIRPTTRVVGLTWVHSCTGVRIPARAIADMLAEVNRSRDETTRIRFVLDGAHGLGVVDESVATLGCDYFCAGTHKWMWAPRGTGIVWARSEGWSHLQPTVPNFSSMDDWNEWMKGGTPKRPTSGFNHSPGGFQAYEHQWAMGAAFAMHEKIGRARVASRIVELNERCKTGLAAIPKVRVVTPRDPALSAGIVCFEVTGRSAEEVGKALVARHIVAAASPYLPSYARFSPAALNTPADIDAGVRAVKEIAAG
ncbi:MAG: aminotransferase class V-fold PLP-dependent enzyme [Candidatus Eisenbacteria bacterium]